MRVLLAGLFLVLLLSPLKAKPWPSGDDTAATPHDPFPEFYKDYRVLSESVSPNGKYGIMYPNPSAMRRLDKEQGIFLISLKPFKVLTVIPGALIQRAGYSYQVNWAPDSSAVTFMADRYWGPGEVYLVTVRDGFAGSIEELAGEVHDELLDEYAKSGAPPYNDVNGFIFKADSGDPDVWQPTSKGQVEIDCICTTDPKGLEPKGWEVEFKSIWDPQKGFLSKTVTQLRPEHGK